MGEGVNWRPWNQTAKPCRIQPSPAGRESDSG